MLKHVNRGAKYSIKSIDIIHVHASNKSQTNLHVYMHILFL